MVCLISVVYDNGNCLDRKAFQIYSTISYVNKLYCVDLHVIKASILSCQNVMSEKVLLSICG